MPETAAVYSETKVRIYGFKKRSRLALCSIVLPIGRLECWGERMADYAPDDGCFHLAFMRQLTGNTIEFFLVLEEDSNGPCLARIRKEMKNEKEASLTLDFPVDMISFHGPHFQDRYGIIHAALDTLKSDNMEILAAGCAGTSICLLVPDNTADHALRLLAEAFVVPESVDS